MAVGDQICGVQGVINQGANAFVKTNEGGNDAGLPADEWTDVKFIIGSLK